MPRALSKDTVSCKQTSDTDRMLHDLAPAMPERGLDFVQANSYTVALKPRTCNSATLLL